MSPQLSNSKREKVLAYIKSTAGEANMLAIPRVFIAITGDPTLALMLSQLVYWTDRIARPDGFVYKSHTDWGVEVGATDYMVRKFKRLPYIETKVQRANGSPTTHYRVRFDLLLKDIQERSEDGLSDFDFGRLKTAKSIRRYLTSSVSKKTIPIVDSDETLTKITTKTTTETTEIKGGPPEKSTSAISDYECKVPGSRVKKINELVTSKNVQESSQPEELDCFSESIEDEDLEGLLDGDDNDDDLQAVSPAPSSSKPHDPYFVAYVSALSKITGLSLKNKTSKARLGRAVRSLAQDGYKLDDIQQFIKFWKEKDWRWKKDHQLPSPEDVVKDIDLSINYKNRERQEYYSAWTR